MPSVTGSSAPSRTTRSTVVAIWTFTAAGVAGVWLIAYRHLALLTFFEVLVGVWLIAMLAAMIFPYRRPGIYRPSPVARLRLFGIPLMTVTGFLGALFLAVYLYLLWTDPDRGRTDDQEAAPRR